MRRYRTVEITADGCVVFAHCLDDVCDVIDHESRAHRTPFGS